MKINPHFHETQTEPLLQIIQLTVFYGYRTRC